MFETTIALCFNIMWKPHKELPTSNPSLCNMHQLSLVCDMHSTVRTVQTTVLFPE